MCGYIDTLKGRPRANATRPNALQLSFRICRSVDLGINLDLDKSENVSVQSTVLKMSEQNGRYKQGVWLIRGGKCCMARIAFSPLCTCSVLVCQWYSLPTLHSLRTITAL